MSDVWKNGGRGLRKSSLPVYFVFEKERKTENREYFQNIVIYGVKQISSWSTFCVPEKHFSSEGREDLFKLIKKCTVKQWQILRMMSSALLHEKGLYTRQSCRDRRRQRERKRERERERESASEGDNRVRGDRNMENVEWGQRREQVGRVREIG